jgi:hypothetical protein
MKKLAITALSLCVLLICYAEKNTLKDNASQQLIGKWRVVIPDPDPSDDYKQLSTSDHIFKADGTGSVIATFENSPKGERGIYTVEYALRWESSKNMYGKQILVLKTGDVKIKEIDASAKIKSSVENRAKESVKAFSNITITTDYTIENGKVMYMNVEGGNPSVYTKIE